MAPAFSLQVKNSAMASATAFTPKSTTLGCVPEPYVNGYVYPAGPLALGSECVAPIIEIRNSLCCPVTVTYESREGCGACANHQTVRPKSFCLIVGLLPSLPTCASTIHVVDTCGNAEDFVLIHSPIYGYDVVPLVDYEEGKVRCRKRPALDLHVCKDPYALAFCGCHAPSWGGNVLLPLRVTCAPHTCAEPEAACQRGALEDSA